MHARQDILCGISKVAFEIPHKIYYSYMTGVYFMEIRQFQELLDLRAHKCFWNNPLVRVCACVLHWWGAIGM